MDKATSDLGTVWPRIRYQNKTLSATLMSFTLSMNEPGLHELGKEPELAICAWELTFWLVRLTSRLRIEKWLLLSCCSSSSSTRTEFLNWNRYAVVWMPLLPRWCHWLGRRTAASQIQDGEEIYWVCISRREHWFRTIQDCQQNQVHLDLDICLAAKHLTRFRGKYHNLMRISQTTQITKNE